MWEYRHISLRTTDKRSNVTAKWNFGQTPDISEGGQLTLYAGWQAQ